MYVDRLGIGHIQDLCRDQTGLGEWSFGLNIKQNPECLNKTGRMCFLESGLPGAFR